MISIIIASVRSDLLLAVTKNIEITIGVPFEIISFNNGNGEMGLCEIYNQGAELAKYDLICYMHEDIIFHTQHWGRIVHRLFSNFDKLGIVGVAGSSFKTLVPSGWGPDSPGGSTVFSSYAQVDLKSGRETTFIHNFEADNFPKVVCVDGLWFCTRRDIVIQLKFDDSLLRGFHCYDLDFCMTVLQQYEVRVTNEIFISHFSKGSYDDNWLADTLKIHEKWKDFLPTFTKPLSYQEKQSIERKAFRVYLRALIRSGNGPSTLFAIVRSYKNAYFMDYKLKIKLFRYALMEWFASKSKL